MTDLSAADSRIQSTMDLLQGASDAASAAVASFEKPGYLSGVQATIAGHLSKGIIDLAPVSSGLAVSPVGIVSLAGVASLSGAALWPASSILMGH